MSLQKYTYRSMQQRPGRTILTLLSIVIGVAAAVAIGLGTATTRNAYKQMFAMVNGRASLQVDGKGQKAFDGSILAKIEALPGVQAAAPTVESQRPVTVGEDKKVLIQILGIDPVRDKNVRDYTVVAGRMVASGNELALEKEFAHFLKLKVGDKVRMSTALKPQTFEVVGLFSPSSGAALSQLAMAFVPIESAQRYFYSSRFVPKGSIDKIQIVTSPSADPDEMLTKIAAILPEEVQVHRPVTNSQMMKETLLSAEKGLLLTTLFTLLMAGFIILNTFLMNVSERRRHLSIMRAVGATRTQISRSLVTESIVLGLVGTLIGIVMGVVAAFVVTFVVARAFQVDLPRLVEVMTIWPFVIGAGFGICMSIAGAIVPAWLAGRVSPLEGMNRIVPPQSKVSAFWSLIAGTVLAGGSLAGIMAGILGYVPVDITTWFGPTFLIGVVILNGLILAPRRGSWPPCSRPGGASRRT